MGQGYITESWAMIVYVNGDSYSVISDGKKYSDFLADALNCTVINSAQSGSSNSRIFRTTLRDLIELKHQNPKEEIVAVVLLSFLQRTEVWDPESKYAHWKKTNDGEFVTISHNSFASLKYRDFSLQHMTWFDVEAATVVLLQNIILLSAWCRANSIKCIIMSSVIQQSIDFAAPFVNSLYNEVINDPAVIDPFTESFTEYCLSKGHTPIDEFKNEIADVTYNVGHHGTAAHNEFSKYLIEKLAL